MEGGSQVSIEASYRSVSYGSKEAKFKAESLVIRATLSPDGDAAVQSSLGYGSESGAIGLTASQILEKLNAILKEYVPEGVESLDPQDFTPEASAERIVQGVTALFPLFKQQNPELEDEVLLEKFMQEVRRGVQDGYDDAFRILEGLGAFQFEGVQDGIEETKRLIEEKLLAFENSKREELGLKPKSDSDLPVEEQVFSELTTQAGASVARGSSALNVLA